MGGSAWTGPSACYWKSGFSIDGFPCRQVVAEAEGKEKKGLTA